MIFLYGTGDYPSYCSALGKIGQSALISQDIAAAERCDGLLLPGGGDIFGKLDFRETVVIDFFVARCLPILGICRGAQALNVYFGGTLYDAIPNHQAPQGDITHPTCATGPMASLLGSYPTVNSNHHQAVNCPGKGLIACQWANDGVIEALWHKTLPILGVQWHPERWGSGDRIFQWFADEMAK